MICPNCKKRMRCTDTFNEVESMITARYYKCECGKSLYTMENVSHKLEVSYVLAKRQMERKRYGKASSGAN